MAGAGWRKWTRERVSADYFQRFIQDQVVMRFASASARDSAMATADLSDGMVAYLEDTDRHWTREGGAYWRPLGARWPKQSVGEALPTTGVQVGDFLYSDVFECAIQWDGAMWKQLHPVLSADGLNAYKARLTARGITSVHNGFLVMNPQTNRIFAGYGSLNFMILNGLPTAAITTGWPAAGSGWTYITPNTNVRSLGNGMALVYCAVTKTGTALAPPATGDLGNVPLGTVPGGFEPSDGTPLVSASNGRLCSGYIGTDGVINLAATTPGGDIAVGNPISLGGIYRMANWDG